MPPDRGRTPEEGGTAASPGGTGAAPETRRARVLWGGCVLCAGLALIGFAGSLLGYPYGVQYEEGVVIDGARRAAQGGRLYGELGRAPFVLDRHGPVYPFLTSFALRAAGMSFFWGRALSLVAAICAAACLWSLLAPAGRACAAAGAAMCLASRDIVSMAGLHRPECLGLLCGLAAVRMACARGAWRRLALPLALCALFTTPLGLAGPCAAAAAFFMRGKGEGVRFTAALLVAWGIAFGALWAATGGQYAAHVFPGVVFAYWWSDAAREVLAPLAVRYGPAAVLAALGAVAALRRRWWPPLVFGAVAFAGAWRMGYETEDRGAWVEAVAGLALLAAIGLCAPWRRVWLARSARVLAAAQGVLLVVFLQNEPFPVMVFSTGPMQARDQRLVRDEETVRLVSEAGGRVLSDDPCIAAVTAAGLGLEPRCFRALERAARADTRDLLAMLDVRVFGSAVLCLNYVRADDGWRELPAGPLQLPAVVRDHLPKTFPVQHSFSVARGAGATRVTTVYRPLPDGMPR